VKGETTCQGMRFDSGGLIDKKDWSEIDTISERDVFERLGLEFIRTLFSMLLAVNWSTRNSDSNISDNSSSSQKRRSLIVVVCCSLLASCMPCLNL
jgi:hypothetical protein